MAQVKTFFKGKKKKKSKKKPYWQHPEYAHWIRRHKCVGWKLDHECRNEGSVDKYGDYLVHASHVKAKGMGGANKQEYGNLVPHCPTCHEKFEGSGTENRQTFRKVAEIMFDNYQSEKLDDLDDMPFSVN